VDAPPNIKQPAKSLWTRYGCFPLLLCFAGALALFGYVGFTRIPPEDAKLIAGFHAHHAAYERLREMIQADDRLRSVDRWGIRTTNSWDTVSPRQTNFPEERYHEYVALLKQVGGRYVARRQGESADPEIVLWAWGFGSTAHNTSICWKHQAPTNQVSSLASHYGRRSADGRREVAYRHIEGNWYLTGM
jgi:hypothetical protein